MSILRPFATFLQALEDGRLHASLTDHVDTIIKTLIEHSANYGGKPKGKLTIEVEFVRNRDTIDVSSKVSTKLPDQPRERSVFWSDREHRLTDENPNQQSLFPRPAAKREEQIN